jgi:ribosomal protein S18 acetylase RimI-like enzyme
MNSMNFRAATTQDAPALGALHAASWRETYTGVLPKELLESQSADVRTAMWRSVLDHPTASGGTTIFVAESKIGFVGFGACGAQRDAKLKAQGFAGEIGAIYVLQSHQRTGIGHTLMTLMAQSLLSQNQTAATLWVLRENGAARSFYERLGGALIAEKPEALSSAMMTEVAYGWHDLRPLLRLTAHSQGKIIDR